MRRKNSRLPANRNSMRVSMLRLDPTMVSKGIRPFESTFGWFGLIVSSDASSQCVAKAPTCQQDETVCGSKCCSASQQWLVKRSADLKAFEWHKLIVRSDGNGSCVAKTPTCQQDETVCGTNCCSSTQQWLLQLLTQLLDKYMLTCSSDGSGTCIAACQKDETLCGTNCCSSNQQWLAKSILDV